MCDCVENIDAALATSGCQLVLAWPLGANLTLLEPRMKVETINTHSRRKGQSIIAAFCPVCGHEYASTVAAQLPQESATEPEADHD